MEPIKLFVYGLLKSSYPFYELNLKSKVIKKLKATTKGDLYFLPNHGCPALCEGNGTVEGEVLFFENSEILKITDEFEEYYENSPETSIFKRVKISVTYEDGTKDESFVYTMDKNDILKYGGMKIEKGIF
jgi:gamma-glutamylcyclotransferase (GGCT)/AIG2-like uncharacterized protein YtfP